MRTSAEIFDVDGRVAIVTGASSGIGERMVRVLATNGMRVIAAARRLERLEALAAEVPGVLAMRCDVTIEDDLEAVVAAAYEEFGRLDVVINNAGMSDAPVKAHEETADQFSRVIDINLNSCFLLARSAAREMIAHESPGSIIKRRCTASCRQHPTTRPPTSRRRRAWSASPASSLASGPVTTSESTALRPATSRRS